MKKHLVVFSFGCICCLLTGCLAILPPVFAQQPPEIADVDEHGAQIADSERQALVSLLAIVVGVCLWGCFRAYQHERCIKNPPCVKAMRRKLLVRIAELDDDYAQGRIREHAYHRKRDYLKQRVLDISRRQYT